MRLSNNADPMVFVRLKDKGVEPGFIVRYDWSHDDSLNLFADVHSLGTRTEIAHQILQRPGSPAACKAATLIGHRPTQDELVDYLDQHPDEMLEIGLLAGRGHDQPIPGYTHFAAVHVLKRELTKVGQSPLRAQFIQNFPDTDPTDFARDIMQRQNAAKLFDVLNKLFQPIRDEIMRPYPKGAPENSCDIFTHYGEQHIVKLDFNESEDTITGSHRKPERTKLKQGKLYHAFKTTSTKEATTGAVSEVLANDLMACSGIPSQELVLRKGLWSDGKPKLMLEGTMAQDYRDLEDFLKDGRLVNAQAGRLHLAELGKYKIMLLLFGDRDGVGSRAQNKGCINDQFFFAIDPGHSLEGKTLTFSNDFSFTANADFKNYSIFDDTSRAEKFRGVVELRRNLVKTTQPFALQDHVTANFEKYRKLARTLDPDTAKAMLSNIDAMEREFTSRLQGIICETFQSQLALYDAIAGDGSNPAAVQQAEAAIELEATMEKLASPTTCLSQNGQVQLHHLEVAPKDRKPATITQDPANGNFTITISGFKNAAEIADYWEKQTSLASRHDRPLANQLKDLAHDTTKGQLTFSLTPNQLHALAQALHEEDIYQFNHPEEFLTRPA